MSNYSDPVEWPVSRLIGQRDQASALLAELSDDRILEKRGIAGAVKAIRAELDRRAEAADGDTQMLALVRGQYLELADRTLAEESRAEAAERRADEAEAKLLAIASAVNDYGNAGVSSVSAIHRVAKAIGKPF